MTHGKSEGAPHRGAPSSWGGCGDDLVARSVRVLEEAQDPGGAFPASPTYPTYRYCWIRDGAFIAEAMDVAGRPERAARLHRWVAGTVLRYRERVEAIERSTPGAPTDDEVLHPRFMLDGSEVPGAWSNFQLDCYGFWLTSLTRHASAHGLPEGAEEAVALTVRFLAAVWDRPSADCWEEHETERHPTSLCAIAGGLDAAARLLGEREPADLGRIVRSWIVEHGTADGALTKFAGGGDLDGSALLVLGPYGPFAPRDRVVAATLEAVERTLVREGGGVHRYLADGFYGGGLWLPLAGALAWVHAARGETRRAREVLSWMEETADDEGHLPEQTLEHLRVPDLLARWERRWGPVARPLLWSHAMYLIARDAVTSAGEPS